MWTSVSLLVEKPFRAVHIRCTMEMEIVPSLSLSCRGMRNV